MKVLVTGSNGQLGKTIQEQHSSLKDIEFVFTSKTSLDITSKAEVDTFFQNNTISYCINCAAYTNVEKAEDDPQEAYLINSDAPQQLALACKNFNITLIHISTDYVFDGESNKPYKEADVTNPLNVYGESKRQGEQNIIEALENYFIIRTSWLYSKFENNFLNTIVEKVNQNENLNIVSSQKGTPTSCDDLTEFILFLISEKINDYGIYHFTGLGEASWYDFAKQIASNFKHYSNENIKPVDTYITKAKRPKYSVLNLKKALNIYPKIKPWHESVNSTIQSLKNSSNN